MVTYEKKSLFWLSSRGGHGSQQKFTLTGSPHSHTGAEDLPISGFWISDLWQIDKSRRTWNNLFRDHINSLLGVPRNNYVYWGSWGSAAMKIRANSHGKLSVKSHVTSYLSKPGKAWGHAG